MNAGGGRAHGGAGAAAMASVEAAYAALGLAPGADEAAVKRAYRAASLLCHPDKPGGSAEKFQAVATAYETLMDAALRAEFAQKLAARAAARARAAEQGAARVKLRSELEARERAGVGGTAYGGAAAAGVASAAAVDSAAAFGTISASHDAREAALASLRRDGEALILAAQEARARAARGAEAERLVRGAAAAFGARPGAAYEPPRPTPPPPSAAAVPDAGDGAFDLGCAVRLHWTPALNAAEGEEEAPAAVGGRVLSEAQVEAAALRALASSGVAAGVHVLAVLSRRATSACLVLDSPAAAGALAARPPPGFRASLVRAPPPAVGAKRPRDGIAFVASGEDGSSSGSDGGLVDTTGGKAPTQRLPVPVPGLDAAAAACLSGGAVNDLGIVEPTAAQNASFTAREAAVLAMLAAGGS